MSNPKRVIKCDREKLVAALAKRGYTIKEAQKEMGYGETALSPSHTAQGISKPMSLALKAIFNISPEDYAPDEPEIVGGVQRNHRKRKWSAQPLIMTCCIRPYMAQYTRL